MYIAVYNLFYTSLPILAVGVFDQDVSDTNSIQYPHLYSPGHSNLLFNKQEFLRSALHGSFTSCVLFLVPYGKYQINFKTRIYFTSPNLYKYLQEMTWKTTNPFNAMLFVTYEC